MKKKVENCKMLLRNIKTMNQTIREFLLPTSTKIRIASIRSKPVVEVSATSVVQEQTAIQVAPMSARTNPRRSRT